MGKEISSLRRHCKLGIITMDVNLFESYVPLSDSLARSSLEKGEQSNEGRKGEQARRLPYPG